MHSDVGGGYPEEESALSKYPLQWLLEEAIQQGMLVNTAMMNHLVEGRARKGSHHNYVPPDPGGKLHNSLRGFWKLLEWIPKSDKLKEWPKRKSWLYPGRGADSLVRGRAHETAPVLQTGEPAQSL